MARKLTIDTSIAINIKSAASDSFKDNIKMIEIGKIKESMDNFYSLSDIEILAEDIERLGLKHNLVVVEDSDEPDTYFIKSGHRRFTAIKQLVRGSQYSSKYVPCLVDGSKTKDENILDLIMLNATTRVMTDSELYKQYEVLKETLERLKADGMKVKGRLRDKVAEALNVSPAQVGKIENIKHNAVDEIKEAVKNGDMTIATADSIAKLPEEEQAEIVTEKPVAEITTKDVRERSERKAKEGSYDRNNKFEMDNDEPINDEDDDFNESNNNDNIVEVPLDGEIRTAEGKQEKLIKWAQTVNQDQLNFLLNSGLYNSAIKGYLMLAAEEAAFTKEQINVLLGGMMKALSNYDKAEVENKFLSI